MNNGVTEIEEFGSSHDSPGAHEPQVQGHDADPVWRQLVSHVRCKFVGCGLLSCR
jgi:hypothetical protein